MYLLNFLDGFDQLVAFDAETTGKRTPDAEFIREQPFAWSEGWRKGETWSSRVNPDGPIDPSAIKIHRIRPADLNNAPPFPAILPRVKDFVGGRQSWPALTTTSEFSSTMSSPGPR